MGGNNITYGAATINISVGRNGLFYAPLYSQAANKTLQLVSPNLNAHNVTVTNSNGYGLELNTAMSLTGANTFTVVNATSSSVVPGLT